MLVLVVSLLLLLLLPELLSCKPPPLALAAAAAAAATLVPAAAAASERNAAGATVDDSPSSCWCVAKATRPSVNTRIERGTRKKEKEAGKVATRQWVAESGGRKTNKCDCVCERERVCVA